MFNSKNLLRQCLLAVALFGGAAAAFAGPTYHVNVETGGQIGLGAIDFFLDPAVTAAPLTATLSNFSSNVGPFASSSGDYTLGTNGNFSLSNQDTLPYVQRDLALGGPLTFDVTFDGAFFDVFGGGSTFSFGLYNGVGLFGVGTFDLDASGGPIVINFVADGIEASSTLAEPNAVPEPSSVLMIMTGLGLVGVTARRRKTPAPAAATA